MSEACPKCGSTTGQHVRCSPCGASYSLDKDHVCTAICAGKSAMGVDRHELGIKPVCSLCAGMTMLPNFMDAPGGPRCACGRRSTQESGWCGVPHDAVPCPRCCQDEALLRGWHWIGLNCTDCGGKGCRACGSTGHVTSQVDVLRLANDHAQTAVRELHRIICRGDHGSTAMNAKCAIDGASSWRETLDEREYELVEARAFVTVLEPQVDAAVGALWSNPTKEQWTPESIRLRIEEILAQKNEAEKRVVELTDRISELEDELPILPM